MLESSGFFSSSRKSSVQRAGAIVQDGIKNMVSISVPRMNFAVRPSTTGWIRYLQPETASALKDGGVEQDLQNFGYTFFGLK